MISFIADQKRISSTIRYDDTGGAAEGGYRNSSFVS